MNFELEELRDAVAETVEQGSLRGVAREIGMSPTGLKKFLGGTDPYGPTLRKLVPWIEQHVLRSRPAPEPAVVASAVDVLVADFSDAEQVQLRADLAAILGRAYAGMAGAEDATGMVMRIQRPGARTAEATMVPRKNRPDPPVSVAGPRPRAPRRRLPMAQRIVAVAGRYASGENRLVQNQIAPARHSTRRGDHD